MTYRILSVMALAFALFASATALAAKAAGDNTHDGKFVSIVADKLSMTGEDGTVHSHILAANVKATLDGKECQTEEIKSGMRIRVTLDTEAPPQVTRIEALDKQPEFEPRD